MKFRRKPLVIDAITFEEFIEYGRTHDATMINGIPWAFQYNGHSVSHESHNRYVVPTNKGLQFFTAQDMLITGVDGEIYPCRKEIFEKTYELAE